MIRRLTALLVMLALLGALAVLIIEVQRHHNRAFQSRDGAIVAKIALGPALPS